MNRRRTRLRHATIAVVVLAVTALVATTLTLAAPAPRADAQLLDGDIDLSVCNSVLRTATRTNPATCTIPTNIGNITLRYDFDGPGPPYIDGFGDIPDGGHFSGGDITITFEDPVENFSLDFFHLNHTREYWHNFSIAPDNVDADGDGNGTSVTYVPNFDENDPFNDNGLLTGPAATWDFARLTWNGPLTEISFSANKNAGFPYTSLDATNGFRFPGGATLFPEPELAVTKTSNDADGLVTAGDTVTYTVVAENIGDAPMTGVTVTDTLPAGTTYVPESTVATSIAKTLDNDPATLDADLVSGDPGVILVDPADTFDLLAGESLTVTYDVTVDAGTTGTLTNAVVADSTETEPANAEDSLFSVAGEPSIDLVKSLLSNADEDASGTVTFADTLTYEFAVTNTGNMDLDPITVADDIIPVVTCPPGPLAPTATVICTADYVVQTDDLLATQVVNTATATGTPPGGTPVDSPPSVVTTPVVATPIECPTEQDLDAYVTGAQTLTGRLGDGTPFTAQTVGNTAGVDFVRGFGSNTNGTSRIYSSSTIYTPSVPLTDVPNLRVTGSVGSVGQMILTFGAPVIDPIISVNNLDNASWNFANTVDNSGTLAAGNIAILSGNDDLVLNGTTISDATVGTADGGFQINPTDASRSAYGSVQLTGEYSQIVIDLTKVTRSIEGVSWHIALDNTCRGPSIKLIKNLGANADEDATSTVTEGDTLTYTFLVKNDGIGALSPISVSDPIAGAVTCPVTTLATGETTTCTATYTVTAADAAAGEIVNTATASGAGENGAPVFSDPDSVTTPVFAPPVVCAAANAIGNGDFLNGGAGWTESHNLDSISGGFSYPNPDGSTLTDAPFGPQAGGVVQSFVDNDGDLAAGNVQLVNDTPITIENGVEYSFAFDIREFPDFGAGTDGTTVNGAELSWVLVDATTNEIVPAQAPLFVMETEDPDRKGGLPLIPKDWDQFNVDFIATVPTGDYKLGMTWDVYADPVPSTELVTDLRIDRVYLAAKDCELEVTKTSSEADGTVSAGQTVTYTVAVESTGEGTLTDVTVADILPLGTTYVPNSTVASSPTQTLDNDGGGLADGDPNGTLVSAADGFDLAAGEILTVTYDVTINPGAPSPLVNSVTADSNETGPGNADVTLTVEVIPPFVCTANQAFLNQGLTGIVSSFDTTIAPFTFVNETTAGANINGLGYNPVDGLLYAVSVDEELYRIGGDGSVVNLGVPTDAVTGAPLTDPVNSGAFDGEGNFWVTQTSSLSFVKIDPFSNTYETFTLSEAIGSSDWAWNPVDNQLYSVRSNTSTDLIAIDPATGTVTVTPIGGEAAGPIGGAWFTPDGVLFVYDNGGTILRVEDPIAGTPAELVSTGPPSSRNDAAACAFGAQLTKDVAPGQAYPGATVTYTFEIDWTVGQPVAGVDLVDLLDFGATYMADSLTVNGTPTNAPLGGTASSAVGGASGAYGAGADLALYDMTLPANSTTTITVDVLIGDEPPGFVDNQATLQDIGPQYSDVPSDYPPSALPGDPTPLEILPPPVITIDKALGSNADEDGSGDVSLGDTLTYSFTVTNPGPVPLDNIVVNDDKIPTVTCPVTSLAALGGTTECEGTYVVTAADVAAGEIVNTAESVGEPPSGPPITSVPDVVTTPVVPQPAIEVVKSLGGNADEDGSTDVSLGDTLTYNFLVENTGDIVLDPIVVSDDKVPAVSCPATSLPPGVATTCSGTYVVTSDDVAAGEVVNTATATGTPPGGPPVDSPPSTVTTPVQPNPALTILKSLAFNADEDLSGDVSLGDTLTYNFVVENTGDVELDPFTVNDDKVPSVDCGTTVLPIATGITCSGTYVVTAADVEAGEVINTATATGTPPTGPPITTPPSQVITPVAQNPAIEVVKSLAANADEDGSTDVTVGDTLTYEFDVTNSGDVTLQDLVVNDDLVDPVTCPVTSLAPQAVTTCSATYVVTAPDVLAGEIVNTATATGTPPNGPPLESPPSVVTTPVVQNPSIALVKSLANNADEDGSAEVTTGDTLTYEFLVTNDGDVPLDPVVVTDTLIATVNCPVTALAPGASTTCSGTYQVTPADAVAAVIVNTATAFGTPPTGLPVPSPESVVVTPVDQNPSLSIAKSLASNADEDDTLDASLGDTLTYEFLVTNDGDVPMTSIVVNDDIVSPVSCPVTSLLPGFTTTCVANYTVTLADVAAGEIVNTATVTSTPPSGPPVDSPPSTVTTPVVAKPSLEITKTVAGNADEDASGGVSIGDTLTYEFLVENTGDIEITGIAVDDPLVNPVTCPTTTLAPGASTTCSVDYTVTAADVAAGEIVNSAVVTGEDPPNGPPLPPIPPSEVTTPVDQNPSMTVVKSLASNADEDASTDVTLGDTLTYEFLVTNDGDVDIANIVVTDSLIPSVTCPVTDLAIGTATTCTADYVVTLADADAGEVINTATVAGDPPPGSPPLPPVPPSTITTPVVQDPAMTITKSLGGNADEDGSTDVTSGDTLTYEFLVENTGNVTLTGIAVTDPLPGLSPVSCPATVLAPGESTTCTATHVVTIADATAGEIANTATGTGEPPPGSPPLPPPPPSTITTPVEQNPELSLVKSYVVNADGDASGDVTLNDVLTYQFDVTNTGDVEMTNITIDDATLGLTDFACDAGPVQPNETVTCTADFTVLQGNVDDLQIVNTATATGDDPGGTPVDSLPDDVTVILDLAPTIALTKSLASNADEDGSTTISAGDTLTYEFLVENNGPLTLNNPTVTDDLIPTVACPPVSLAPGETTTCSGTYSVTQDDVNIGQIINTATATGTPLVALPPVSPPSIVTTPIPGDALLTLVKSFGGNADEDASGDVSVDDTLTYEFLATNAGDLTITNLVVTDALPGLSAITCPVTTLQPTEATTCTATYVVTQADVDAEEILNTATGGGNTPPNRPPLPPPPDTEENIPIVPDTGIAVTKSLAANADEDGSTDVSLGDTLSYEFLVENTGDVTLDSVEVNDTIIPSVSCLQTTLAPGVTVTCTGSYVVTATDVDAGEVVNTATATGTPPNGTPIDSPPSQVTTPVVQNAAITLTKSVGSNADEDASGDVSLDDTLTFEFLVENTGDVTLDNIAVTDDFITAAVVCPVTSLAIGESTVCTADYVVTGEDVEAGFFENTATATGEPPSGPPIDSPPSTVNTVVAQTPSLVVTKSLASNADEDASTDVTVNDTLTYEFLVENTGDITISGIVVDDPTAGTVTCPTTSLAPGETTTCTVDYVVTTADAFVGEIVNTAVVTGETPPGAPPLPPVPPTSVTTPVASNPEISLVKSLGANADEDDSGDVSLGDTLTYEFLVTNPGDVSLAALTVDDPLVTPVVCQASILVPGASTVCVGEYVVTLPDVAAAEIVNTATATGEPPLGPPVESPESTVTVPVVPKPALTVVKSVGANADEDSSGDVTVGDTLTYDFLITNTGDITLDPIAVSDTLIPVVDCAVTSLAPGFSTTCSADYVVTDDDADAGEVVNTATVTGQPPAGPPVDSPPSEVTTPVEQNPAMTVAKSFAGNADEDASGDVSLDDTLTYEFLVENTGDVTVTGIVVDDSLIADVTCPATELAAGASLTCSATYVVTADDVIAGEVVNTAVITGNPPPGSPPLPPVPPSEVTTPVVAKPAIEVTKSLGSNADEDASGDPTLDDTLTYEFVVENTGDVPLTSVAVDDSLIPTVNCPVTELAVGASTTCTGDYVITETDVLALGVVNTATALGEPPLGPPVESPESTVTVPVGQNPALEVSKSQAGNADEDASGDVTLGDTLTYEFVVENTGDVPMTDIAVDDSLIPVVTCPVTELAVGASTTCTADYVVTDDDADAGEVVNTATVSGQPPQGPPLESPPSEVTTPVEQNPSMTVEKVFAGNSDEDASGDVSLDDTLNYEFVVENTGDVTLTNIVVSDSLIPAVGCPSTTVAAGASMTCTASYVVTADDVIAGEVVNVGTVTGDGPPGGPPLSPPPPSEVTTPVVAKPALEVAKSLGSNADEDGSGDPTLNDTLTFEFVVENTGDVPVTNIAVNDSLIPSVTCPVSELAVGASTTCSGDYLITEADVIALGVVNTATVSGEPPQGPPVESPPSTTTVPVGQNPALTVEKSLGSNADEDGSGDVSVGDTLSYAFVVENTGDVVVDNIVVDDVLIPTVTCPFPSLGLGESMTCGGSYVVTDADTDDGEVVNTATVTGEPPQGPPVESPPSEVTTPVAQNPSMTVQKLVAGNTDEDASGDVSLGDTLNYEFVVENTGDVTLTNIVVADSLIPTVACPSTTVAVGASMTCAASYIVTAADVIAGEVVNVGTVTGDGPPGGPQPPPPPPSEVTTPVAPKPALEVAKSLGSNADEDGSGDPTLGDTLTFEFVVENTGDVPVTGIAVNDSLIPSVTCPVSELAVGASTTCSGDYVITPDDVAALGVVNTATVTGEPPQGPPVESPPSTITVPVGQNPALEVSKSLASNADEDASGDVSLDDTLTYEFLVVNTGDIAIDSIEVSDALVPAVTCPFTSLALGASMTCSGTYSVTADDVSAASVVNTATVTGQPPQGPPIESPPSEVTSPVAQNPAIEVTKSFGSNADEDASGDITLGDTLTYEFLAENTGDVALTGLVVNDALIATVVCQATTLAAGASTICTADYVVTPDDAIAGQILNTATATGTPPSGPPVDSPESSVQVFVGQNPSMTIAKSLAGNADEDGSTDISVNDTLTYEFVLENTGDVPLTNIGVTDVLIPTVSCPVVDLAVGASTICSATYVVTQDDVNAGEVVNSATGTGDGPPGSPPLPPVPPSEIVTPVLRDPSMTVSKSLGDNADEDGSTDITVGDTLTYEFLVANTGNVPLTGILVTDPLPGTSPVACPTTVLQPGEDMTCSATRQVSVADATAGEIVNSVTVTGDPPPGGPPLPPVPPSEIVTPVEQNPALVLVKSLVVNADEDTSGDVTLNDTLTYQFDVTNDGDVALTDIVINDAQLGLAPLACDAGPVLPGVTVTCQADYVVTQTDVNALQIVNTATATGTPPSGIPLDSTPSSVTVVLDLAPTIAVSKSLAGNADEDASSDVSVDDTLTYEFVIENNGPLTLSDPAVTDALIADVACPAVTLDPGQSTTCTGTYVVTQDDVDSGEIINTAIVTADPPPGSPPPVSPPSIVTTPIPQNPALTFVKSFGGNADEDASGDLTLDDTLTYEFEVTNSGNLTVSGIVVTDPLPGLSPVICPLTELAPNQSTTCTATYVVTQDDMDNGMVVNAATVGGRTPPEGPPLPPPPGSMVEIPTSGQPGLTVVKTVGANADQDGSGDVTLGDSLTYEFAVTNTGDVTIDNLVVDDALVPVVSCLVTTLLPGESVTCTGIYIVSEEDADAGVNAATVGGRTPPEGPPLPPPPGSMVEIPTSGQPGLTVAKTVGSNADEDGSGDVTAGDTLTYEFAAENTGDVTIDNLVVNDALIDTVTCPVTSLAAGESTVCSGEYVVTLEDIEAGQVVNSATVTGEPPQGPPLESPPSEVITPVEQNPGLTVVKTVGSNADEDGSGGVSLGDTLTYEFAAENTGDVSIDNLTVNDDLIPTVTCPVTTLAVGASTTCTGDYVVTADDVIAGQVTNAATVTGDPPQGPPIVSPPAGRETPVDQDASMQVTKTVAGNADEDGSGGASVGDTLTYEFVIENTGNATITNISVVDPKIPTVICPVTTLARGESTTCSATYVITQDDVDSGGVSNVATVTGRPPQGPPIESPPSESNEPVERNPAMTVAKAFQGNADEDDSGSVTQGDKLTYEITVENTGNVTLTGIVVEDSLVPAVSCPQTTLAVGEEIVCEAAYVVTAADAARGRVINEATVSGDPPPGSPPLPEPPTSVSEIEVDRKAEIGVAKAITSGPTTNGDGTYTLTYTIVVLNTGDVEVTEVVVDDDLAEAFAGSDSFTLDSTGGDTDLLGDGVDLDPDEQATVTLTVTVDPGANFGPYDNTAMAVAQSALGVVSDRSDSGSNADPANPNPGAPGDSGGTDDATPVTFPRPPAPRPAPPVSAQPEGPTGPLTVPSRVIPAESEPSFPLALTGNNSTLPIALAMALMFLGGVVLITVRRRSEDEEGADE